MSEIMNTLPLSHENYDLILNNFGELLQIQKAKGRIDDEDFERMGFQKDKYFDGTEFERKSDYVPRMRAMDLSHSWWVQYQEKAISDMKMKEYQKLLKCYNNWENVLLNARACAEVVIANMRKEGKKIVMFLKRTCNTLHLLIVRFQN